MTSTRPRGEFNDPADSDLFSYAADTYSADEGLRRVADRLAQTLARDALVQTTVESLREQFQVDRVVALTIVLTMSTLSYT